MGDSFHRATGSWRDRTSAVRCCAAAGAVVGLLAAGCGTQTSPSAAPAAPSAAPAKVADAAGVDMCTILSDSELTALGVRLDSRRPFNTQGVIGCRWLGKPYTLSMERDNSTLAGYQAQRTRPQFVDFSDNTVNGRSGAHFSISRSGLQCVQLIDGGSTSLSINVAVPANLKPAPIKPCDEALRIAEMVEPRLPRAPK
jgi:hypothetical protein